MRWPRHLKFFRITRTDCVVHESSRLWSHAEGVTATAELWRRIGYMCDLRLFGSVPPQLDPDLRLPKMTSMTNSADALRGSSVFCCTDFSKGLPVF
mmetsp:Transcript_59701/g.193424  ORF Transcript_59701/g.193424 Transcript_59701/m.193424 type:complete len:96 (+) Transcript_59701:247-534(+)